MSVPLGEEVRVESRRTGDLVLGRLLPGTPLIPGLLAACARHSVRFAVVSSLIGSLRETAFMYIQPDAGSPSGVRYGETVRIRGGVEIIACQGMIGEWDDGRPTAHLHYTLVDTAGQSHCGHVLETENPCLVTVEFALRIVEGITIIRRVDPELGFPVFMFEQGE